MERWAEAHQHLAAWVQALGTPLALALTIWATTHSTGQARRIANQGRLAIAGQIRNALAPVDEIIWVYSGERTLEEGIETCILMRKTFERALETPREAWPSLSLPDAVEWCSARCDELAQQLQIIVESRSPGSDESRPISDDQAEKLEGLIGGFIFEMTLLAIRAGAELEALGLRARLKRSFDRRTKEWSIIRREPCYALRESDLGDRPN